MRIEIGYCECGCGKRTRIASRNDPRHGYVKGLPMRFIRGHSNVLRRRNERWVEQDCGYLTPCRIWQLALNADGYGIERVAGRTVLAHRNAYELEFGPVPVGFELDHLCRVRDCVRSDHLEPVTCAINVRRGDACVLAVGQVEEIRSRVAAGESRADVARAFGVGWTTAANIAAGRTWRETSCA